MTTASTIYGAPAAYSMAASLAAPNYDLSGPTYNSTTNKPMDVLFEYSATPAANPTGNKMISLFVIAALDGSNFPPGPTSATDTTHDTSMRRLGSIMCNNGSSAAEVVRDLFSIAGAFPNGVLPPYWKVIAKNDCGVTLSTITARTQEIGFGAS